MAGKNKVLQCLVNDFTMKMSLECGGIAPHIHQFSCGWRRIVSFIPWLLCACGNSHCPSAQRLSWSVLLPGHEGSKKNLCVCWDLNVSPSACSLVASDWDVLVSFKNVNNISSVVRIAYLEVKLTVAVCHGTSYYCLCAMARLVTDLYSMHYRSQRCATHSSIFSAVLFQVWHTFVSLLKTVSTPVWRSAFCICLGRKGRELSSHPGNVWVWLG
jgi:hypothetical protein